MKYKQLALFFIKRQKLITECLKLFSLSDLEVSQAQLAGVRQGRSRRQKRQYRAS